jgi:hypothetical protein
MTQLIAAVVFIGAIAILLHPYQHAIVVSIAIYLAIRGWLWLCRAHPLIGWAAFGFLQGLLGGRRRWW